MKKQIAIILLFLATMSCEKDNGFTAAGPVGMYLVGKWELKKIENTKTLKVNNQLNYSEILEVGNDNIEDFHKVFLDGKLTNKYIVDRSRSSEASAKNMTILEKFRDNKVRFFKIINKNDASGTILEASGYLEEIGTIADTLKYYYSPVK